MAPGCGKRPRRFAGAPPTLCSLCEATRHLDTNLYAETRSRFTRARPAKPKSSDRRLTERDLRHPATFDFIFFSPFHLIICTVYTIAKLNRSNHHIFIPLPHDVLTLSSVSALFYLHVFAIYLHHCKFANA